MKVKIFKPFTFVCALVCALVLSTPGFAADEVASNSTSHEASSMLPAYAKEVPLWSGGALSEPGAAARIASAAPQSVRAVPVDSMRALLIGMPEEQVVSAIGQPASRGPRGLMQYVVAAANGTRFVASMWLNDAGRLWMGSTTAAPTTALAESLVPAAPVVAAAPPMPVPKKTVLRVSEVFAFGSDRLRADQSRLDDLAVAMREHPEVARVAITGYTDRLGSEAVNLTLSQRRAQAVRSYLMARGVPSERLSAAGMGEANALVSCDGIKRRAQLIECLAPNRRVEIVTE